MKLVLIDLFGVFVTNSYTPWVIYGSSSENLENFVINGRTQKNLPYAQECDLPGHDEHDYFFRLISYNDREHKISDEEFYNILSSASGESAEAIRTMIHSEKENPDILDFITKIQKNSHIKIALISSSSEPIVRETVERSSVVFDNVIWNADKRSCKLYHDLADANDINIQDIFLIDDSLKNVNAAQNCDIAAAIHYNNITSIDDILHTIIGDIHV